jgi:hypothetical protein
VDKWPSPNLILVIYVTRVRTPISLNTKLSLRSFWTWKNYFMYMDTIFVLSNVTKGDKFYSKLRILQTNILWILYVLPTELKRFDVSKRDICINVCDVCDVVISKHWHVYIWHNITSFVKNMSNWDAFIECLPSVLILFFMFSKIPYRYKTSISCTAPLNNYKMTL